MSRDRNAGRGHSVKIDNSSIERVEEFKYLGTMLTDQNSTIILPVVLYGCETWSLTLREERRLRVSENMVLRRVFGPKKDEV
jgi:hypothetical protein